MTVPSWVVNVWCWRPVSAAAPLAVVDTAVTETETGAADDDGDGDALSSPHDAAIKITPTHIPSAARAAPNCFIRSFCPRVKRWRSANRRLSLSTTHTSRRP